MFHKFHTKGTNLVIEFRVDFFFKNKLKTLKNHKNPVIKLNLMGIVFGMGDLPGGLNILAQANGTQAHW